MKKLLILLFASFAGHGVEFFVDTTTDSIDVFIGDGLCEDSNGDCNLRAAIQETNQLIGSDTIYLSRNTTYTLSLTSGVSESDFGDLDISDSLAISIENPFAGAASVAELPVIFGNSIDRVLHLTIAEAVILNGLLITSGNAKTLSGISGAGGAILVDGSVNNFTLQNSVLSFNRANSGGALESYAENSLIFFSDISHNEITSGATNPQGAAILNRGGNMTIRASSIHHNSKDETVAGCSEAIFNLNTSSDLYIYTTNVSDNGVGDNVCVSGVSGQNSNVYLINASIYNNIGAGITFFDFEPDDHELFVRNSIIANNQLSNCIGINTGLINFGDANGGNNIVSDTTCPMPSGFGNQENTDPQLSLIKYIFPGNDINFAYYEPLLASPAIDQGSLLDNTVDDPNACTVLDQVLRTRPLDGNGDGSAICDIGAVEVNYDLIFKDSFE